MTPQELVDYVIVKTDLNVIAITDHDTIAGAIAAGEYLNFLGDPRKSEIIVGSEITAQDGHVIGLFLNDNVPSNMTALDTINAIHKQGGLAIAVHPYSFIFRSYGMHGVGNKTITLAFDGVETRNAIPTELFTNHLAFLINFMNRNYPTFAGSDAHYLIMVGRTYTAFYGNSADDLHKAIIEGQVSARGQDRWSDSSYANLCSTTAACCASKIE
jgi:predicted metal-dependent phosphoesterase TrpH